MVRPNYQETSRERFPLPRLPPWTWRFAGNEATGAKFMRGEKASLCTREPKLKFRAHYIYFNRLKVFGEGCGKHLLSKRGVPLNIYPPCFLGRAREGIFSKISSRNKSYPYKYARYRVLCVPFFLERCFVPFLKMACPHLFRIRFLFQGI